MGENGKYFELLAAQSAAGQTIKAGAATIGCSERQAYRIAATPEFKLRVGELRSAAIDAAVGKISAATSAAVDKLVELLNDPQSAVQAAKAILVHVTPLSELGELRARVDRIEQLTSTGLRIAQ